MSSLSPQQQQVMTAVLTKENNVFFTGAAGVGKSYVMRRIISALQAKHGKNAVAVTASTGIAALNIGGCTIHSWANVGTGEGDVAALLRRIKENKVSAARWRRTRVLVIDEVSMISDRLFEKLAEIANSMRGPTNLPFGGIQLVMTADFFQLPPVVQRGQEVCFLFQSAIFQSCFKNNTFVLNQVFRQSDTAFVQLLNELRVGHVSDQTVEILSGLQDPPAAWGGNLPCELTSLNMDVEKMNNLRLREIEAETHSFNAVDTGLECYRNALKKSCRAPLLLNLKVGALVMLIKNRPDSQLVNGSMGTVDSFDTDGSPRVRFFSDTAVLVTIEREKWSLEMNERVLATRTQYPLMLAWCLSIHKSQGQTIERLKVDLSSVFECGQVYVALSRATSLDSLQVIGFNRSRVRVHQQVVEFYRQLEEAAA